MAEPFGSYPPLPYWLMAAPGSVLGFNEFEHKRPWWSNAAWASYRLIPWILFLPFAGSARRTPGFALTIGWAAAIFALLTLSSSKRSNYLTYLCPAFAMSVGILIDALCRQSAAKARRPLYVLGTAIAGAGLAGLVAPIQWKGNFALMSGALTATLVLMIAGGPAILVLARWNGAIAGTAALAAMLGLGIVYELAVIEPRLDVEGREGTAFCRRVAAALPDGAVLGTRGDREHEGSFQFYLRRAVPPRREGPGYYLGMAEDRDSFDPSKVRVLDQLSDDRGRTRYFFKVER